MNPTLVLHVGAMKTGTTYVQNLLIANADRLRAQGWYLPEQRRVVRATRQLLSLSDGSRPGGDAPRWTRLMDEVREQTALPGMRGAVISMEFLSYARPAGVQRVVAGAEGLDLHVVLTARDAVKALPSQWQSLSRNGFGRSWPEFAIAARTSRHRPPPPGARAFRRTQDLPRMLRTWSQGVAPDRFTVVTVPGGRDQPRTLLWERFLSVLGVDPARADAAGAFDNPQLGYGSCELLRRVNAAGLGAESPSAYRRVMRRVTHEHLLHLRGQQTRPRLDVATAAFAVDLNARSRSAVQRHARLVGDPDDLPTELTPDSSLDDGSEPRQVDDAEVRRAADVLFEASVAVCAEQGLRPPPALTAPLPPGLDDAVARIHALLTAAIRGEAPTDDEDPAATDDDGDHEGDHAGWDDDAR